MRTLLLLALITFSEATIGVFVKLTDGRIPIRLFGVERGLGGESSADQEHA